jgi:fimbrial chaperone protein
VTSRNRWFRRLVLCAALWNCAAAAVAAQFSVTPIRVDLAPGVMNETITVTNDGDSPLRVLVKLSLWTQDASGADVYTDSADLIYFPRQLQIEPGGKKLVRVGAKTPGGVTERAYRLFIEEQPEPASSSSTSRLSFQLRFGVPIFVAPVNPKPQPEVGDPVLAAGKVSIAVRNPGNASFRLNRIAITNASGFSQEATGWYSLAGTSRTYDIDIPRDVCRKGGEFDITFEGEKVKVERKVQVDPARCS